MTINQTLDKTPLKAKRHKMIKHDGDILQPFTIWGAWIKGSGLFLRYLLDLSKQFTSGSLHVQRITNKIEQAETPVAGLVYSRMEDTLINSAAIQPPGK